MEMASCGYWVCVITEYSKIFIKLWFTIVLSSACVVRRGYFSNCIRFFTLGKTLVKKPSSMLKFGLFPLTSCAPQVAHIIILKSNCQIEYERCLPRITRLKKNHEFQKHNWAQIESKIKSKCNLQNMYSVLITLQ